MTLLTDCTPLATSTSFSHWSRAIITNTISGHCIASLMPTLSDLSARRLIETIDRSAIGHGYRRSHTTIYVREGANAPRHQ
ncbi:MAG: hypothetical protein FD120_2288 [Gammaproteobacteria bacterium]|nr:MAG: hypothetical protein FD120_2288 [Gammaproteobacteria bacterium]